MDVDALGLGAVSGELEQCLGYLKYCMNCLKCSCVWFEWVGLLIEGINVDISLNVSG